MFAYGCGTDYRQTVTTCVKFMHFPMATEALLRIGDLETAGRADVRFPTDAPHQCLRRDLQCADQFDQRFESRKSTAALHQAHLGAVDRGAKRELFLTEAGRFTQFDEVCGEAGWTSAPAGFAGIVNDAVAFYFGDASLAQAFVNRFCWGYRAVEVNPTVEGAFSLRSEASTPHRTALVHKTS